VHPWSCFSPDCSDNSITNLTEIVLKTVSISHRDNDYQSMPSHSWALTQCMSGDWNLRPHFLQLAIFSRPWYWQCFNVQWPVNKLLSRLHSSCPSSLGLEALYWVFQWRNSSQAWRSSPTCLSFGHSFTLNVSAHSNIETGGSEMRNDLVSYSTCSYHPFYYRDSGSKGQRGWALNTLYSIINCFAVFSEIHSHS
jgi:hypothetical protein